MIFFISYPKCGRTWCRTIVEEYARRAGLPQPEPKKKILWTHITFGNQRDPGDKGEKWLQDGARRILLKRNDLDALVSLYHDQMKRVTNVKKNYKNKTIDNFVLDKSDHLLKFKEKCRELTYEYEFSYEKMIKNPYKTFLPVMEIIFGEVDKEIFKEVIEFCHFDNLSKLEREGKIDMRGSKQFRKTRKGKVGSHKEELRKETIVKLEKKFRK